MVAARLSRRADGWSWVAASVYGPQTSARRMELWEDINELATTFQGIPVIIGGDFNVTLEAADRPNGLGGQDPGSTDFRDVLAQARLQEMGPSDCRFTWRGSTNPMARSRLDRFLCSVEMLEVFPSARVTALPRPISDHTPIMWTSHGETDRPPYFKIDRSWFREEGFVEDLATLWEAQPARGFASARLVTKLNGLRHHLIGWRRRIREDRTRTRDGALSAM